MNICTQKPLNHSVSDIENQLIELSDIIGSISGSNASFTDSLARFIQKIGKPLEEMTIAELATIVEQCNQAFNAGTEPQIERLTVSCTKHKSLKKQHDIIGSSLAVFESSSTNDNRLNAAQDTIELVRILQDLSNDLSRSSRFNVYVLDKAKKLIAERVSFNQALEYENCVIKFAGMEVA